MSRATRPMIQILVGLILMPLLSGRSSMEIEAASGRRFRVQPRLMVEPCLWCWEVRDPVHGELIESSWADEWTAYDSPDEALLAAARRVAEL